MPPPSSNKEPLPLPARELWQEGSWGVGTFTTAQWWWRLDTYNGYPCPAVTRTSPTFRCHQKLGGESGPQPPLPSNQAAPPLPLPCQRRTKKSQLPQNLKSFRTKYKIVQVSIFKKKSYQEPGQLQTERKKAINKWPRQGDKDQQRVRGWERYQANEHQRKARVTGRVLTWDKVDLRAKQIIKERRINDKRVNPPRTVTILNAYAPNSRATK